MIPLISYRPRITRRERSCDKSDNKKKARHDLDEVIQKLVETRCSLYEAVVSFVSKKSVRSWRWFDLKLMMYVVVPIFVLGVLPHGDVEQESVEFGLRSECFWRCPARIS